MNKPILFSLPFEVHKSTRQNFLWTYCMYWRAWSGLIWLKTRTNVWGSCGHVNARKIRGNILTSWETSSLRDCRLPPWCKWDLCSSGGVTQLRLVVTCRSFGKTFRVQTSGVKQFEKKSDCFTLEGVKYMGRGKGFVHSPNSIRALPSSEFSVLYFLGIFPEVKAAGA